MTKTKIIIAFVLGVSIAVAGSMYAAFQINTKDPSQSRVIVPMQPTYENPSDDIEAGPDFEPIDYIAEQKAFDESVKKTAELQAKNKTLEARVKDLEITVIKLDARLNAIEAEELYGN